ncbi:aminomethyl-transferring glycine dehydrogenase subunit GcvPA, partial [bacterium]|nr:aminomethyl-transferring glycine dehydrogenase subunit GcvPA [bacterium]
MPYIPNTDRDREEMLREIGVSSFDDLIADIPEALRLRGDIDVPGPLSEPELMQHMERLAGLNRKPGEITSFLGGGVYDHASPAAVHHVAGLPHFYTAYTPYQPEVSQGTLQAIYEFQSLVAELTGMEVANASLYDGATAVAEAALMALSAQRKRSKICVSAAVNPASLAVLKTYLTASDVEIVELPLSNGVTDVDALARASVDAAAVIIQHPNFLGLLEPVDAIASAAEESGALLVASVDPISLGALKPPSAYGVAIAVGEGQSLGSPVAFGGPLLGFMATSAKRARRMPGRIVGATTDSEDRRGYVMTLQTREQHIRREKATSNICTNQGLVALAATVYLSLLGGTGLKELSAHVLAKSHYAAGELANVPGVKLKFDGAFFREFVIELPVDAAGVKEALTEVGIWPGIKCGCYYPGMEHCLLVSVTEKHTRQDID